MTVQNCSIRQSRLALAIAIDKPSFATCATINIREGFGTSVPSFSANFNGINLTKERIDSIARLPKMAAL